MRTLTSAELAVLGLLVEQPRHGYEIEQVISDRGMREWTEIGFSSIYYILDRLEKAGLATATASPSPGRGPARRVHTATRNGHEAWRAATLAALSTPALGDRPFLLGLAGIAGLSRDEAVDALVTYAQALETHRVRLLERRAAQAPLPWFADALFDHGIAQLAAERAWVTGFMTTVPPEAPELAEAPETNGMAGLAQPHPAPEVTRMPTATRSRSLKPFIPALATLPPRTMAVVRTTGDPSETGARAFPALYGAVYPLKFALKKDGVAFAIEPPCARWYNGPDWRAVPRGQWTAAWAIPIPDGTTELPQKDPATPVEVERWEYGDVAQVLHIGTYAEEEPTIEALHAFIVAQGLEIIGPHEEVYVSRPGAANQKTVIRYQVGRPG